MHIFSTCVALAASVANICLGVIYLAVPRAATLSFGLPLPEAGVNVSWWLRLKGSRDVVSGLVVLAVVARRDPSMLGIVLLLEALIPVSDMASVFVAKGSTARALGIHGVTAALMIAGAVPLIAGPA